MDNYNGTELEKGKTINFLNYFQDTIFRIDTCKYLKRIFYELLFPIELDNIVSSMYEVKSKKGNSLFTYFGNELLRLDMQMDNHV